MFNDLVRKFHDRVTSATTITPLQSLTSFVVPTGHMFGDFLMDFREVVASVMASEHELSMADAMMQSEVPTLIDQAPPIVFSIFILRAPR